MDQSMKKNLIIVRSKKRYFWSHMVLAPNIEIKELYRKEFHNPLIEKHRKKRIENNYDYWGILGDWSKRLNEYKKIIFLDSAYSSQVERTLKEYDGDIIICYWNKLDQADARMLDFFPKKYKLYSYNPYDCDRYGLNYNSITYIPLSYGENNVIKYDIGFGGALIEGRDRDLDIWFGKFKEMGFTVWSDIVATKKWSKKYLPKNYKVKAKALSYDEYINGLRECKAVFHLDKYEEMGLALRAVEALFLNKKLITDSKDIVHEKFYCPENIFVIGIDKIDDLPEFMAKDMVAYSEEAKSEFDIVRWAERF